MRWNGRTPKLKTCDLPEEKKRKKYLEANVFITWSGRLLALCGMKFTCEHSDCWTSIVLCANVTHLQFNYNTHAEKPAGGLLPKQPGHSRCNCVCFWNSHAKKHATEPFDWKGPVPSEAPLKKKKKTATCLCGCVCSVHVCVFGWQCVFPYVCVCVCSFV